MKKLFLLTLLSFSISIFAAVKVEDRKYKTIDHIENQTYTCTACNQLKFWLNTGAITLENSTDEINFTFKITDRAGEYRSNIEYYFGKNIYFDKDRYGEKGNLWIAVDVVYPLSSKKEVCFIHNYTVKSYSKVTESWEPESYTELVFVGKDTQKKRITYKFKDPNQSVYDKIINYIVDGLNSKVFTSINLAYIPDYKFSENTLVVLNNGKKYGEVTASSSNYSVSKSVASTKPNYVGDSDNSSSGGKSSSKTSKRTERTIQIEGGEIFCEYLDGQLVHTRTTYHDSKNYDDCLYGADGFTSCEHYFLCPCNGSKKFISCGGMAYIPYFGKCWGCNGTGRCNCDERGFRKSVTNSGGAAANVPRTLDYGDSNSSVVSGSSNSSSSSNRYGYYDCPSCYGSGKCQICHGKGIQDHGYTATNSKCRQCGGTGLCTSCGGTRKKYGVK